LDNPDENNDLNEADQYLMEGDHESARELYEKVLAEDPNNWRALNGMGLVFSASNTEESITYFSRAVDNCYKSESPFINLGVAYSKLGQGQKAIKAWEKGIERLGKGSESIHLLQALGLEYLYGVNDLNRADEYFQNALLIDPDNRDFLYYIGLIHEEKGNFEKAEEFYLKSRTFNSYGNLGLLYRSLNRQAESISAFNSALEIEESYLIRFSLAAIYIDLDDKEKAMTNLKAGLLQYPHSCHVKKMLRKMADSGEYSEDALELLVESESQGRSPDKAISVNSVRAEYDIMKDDCCPKCFSRLEFVKQSLIDREGIFYDYIETICKNCGEQKDFWFSIASFFP